MIVFSCPTCRNTMQVPPAMAGQPVTCLYCRYPVLVPPPAPEPLALEDPIDDDERERRTLAQRAARDKKLKRKSLISIGFGFLLVLLAVGLFVAVGARLTANARGAQPITGAELLAFEADPQSPPWVAHTADKVIETDLGFNQPTGRHTNEPVRFVMVPTQDRWLVAERPLEEKGNVIEGKLEVWNDGTQKDAVDRIKARYPDLKDKWLPVQLSATPSGASTNAMLQLIALGALVLIGLGFAVSGILSLPRLPQ